MPFGFADDYSNQQQVAAAPAPEQDDEAANQVEALTGEIDAMQEEIASREYLSPPPSATKPTAEEQPASTILVYRDGHQMEVQNYAVMGQTVWVIGQNTTRKVPLSDLDLDVTQKLNADRGVDFEPPVSR